MRKIHQLILVTSLLSAPLVAQAQNYNSGNWEQGFKNMTTAIDEVGTSIKALIKYLNNVVNATAEKTGDLMYEIDPGLNPNIKITATSKLAHKNAVKTAEKLSTCQIYQTYLGVYSDVKGYADNPALAPLAQLCNGKDYKDVVQDVGTLAPIVAADSVALMEPGTSFNIGSLFGGGSPRAAGPAIGNKNFEYRSLFGPAAYNEKQYQRAIRYINFVGQLYQPLPKPALSGINDPKTRKKLRTSPSYQAYQVALRSIIAQRSMGLSSLYRNVTERKEQPEIILLQLFDKDGKQIKSPLQLAHYLATFRADDPTWYQKMATASKATLARERLLISANIQKQLFQLHMDNERISNLLSMLVIGGVNTNAKITLQLATSAADSSQSGGQEDLSNPNEQGNPQQEQIRQQLKEKIQTLPEDKQQELQNLGN